MNMNIKVSLPPDDRGFIGRECPNCHKYFKVKFRTEFSTSVFYCPYCGYSGEFEKFFTKNQIEYVKTIALREIINQVIEPAIKKLERTSKGLEKATRGGFIQIKIKTQRLPMTLPLKPYQEKEVETYITCDYCGLEFAIYGVFANCPYCGKLNAITVFRKSIEVSRKRLQLLNYIREDHELQEAILEDALSGGVSSFDALGKALQLHYPTIFPQRPKNLFQNLDALSKALSKSVGKSLSDLIGKENFEFLFKMFQVRHICEHNMGVVDSNFVHKVPKLKHLEGRKYPLRKNEIEKFLMLVLETGNNILKIIEENE